MEILVSTHNAGKVSEIKDGLKVPGLILVTLADLGIVGAAIEDGNTLFENAQKKARFAREQISGSYWVLADDAGLFIDALNGEPGVNTANWAGPGATATQTIDYCLTRMRGIENRAATFKCVIVVISPDGVSKVAIGEVRGTLLNAAEGAIHPQLPYDNVFVPIGSEVPFSKMDLAERNKLSHRGIALSKLSELLR